MDHHNQHVLTLANSIIGVSILAMPYCFKQCGILLAIMILLLSSLISRLTCHFLIKSAIMARRKTFEYLAYYIFGGLGKFGIEVGITGFLIGTCIAFFVVMGDLGPQIISEITGQNTSNTMRSSILMALALFCVLPLGLLRNIDSLSGVSRATIGFYFCLILKIVLEALPHLFSGDWINKVEIWRPAGVIQCLPIFSMALSCQTQLFEIYRVVNNPTLEKMNHIVKNAVNICTLVYFLVGFFGYIAFAHRNFTGNILLSFAPSLLTNAIKFGFILSIAFSFPLVIFPCRASIHSLIYRQGFAIHEGTSNYIPEGRFKGLTLIIIFVSLIVGILIPNIELVLGLVGSTIGIMICILFPVVCFIYIFEKNTNERLFAKIILVVGLILMVLGTYENLHSLEKIDSSPVVENLLSENRKLKIIDPAAKDLAKNIDKNPSDDLVVPDLNVIKKIYNETKLETIVKVTNSPEIRHEPPQPVEPPDSLPVPEKPKSEENPEKMGKQNVDLNFVLIKNPENKIENQPTQQKEVIKVEKDDDLAETNVEKKNLDDVQNSKPNATKNDQVDIEAIKKDDKESQLQQKEENIRNSHLEDHKILLDTIQKQNEFQEEMVKQHMKLIKVIEKQQEQQTKEEKLKAVKEIESIALRAIEKISSDVEKNEKIVAELEKDVIQKVSSNENVQPKIEKESDRVKEKVQPEQTFENMLMDAKVKRLDITTKGTMEGSKDNKRADIELNPIKNNHSLDQNVVLNEKSNGPQKSILILNKTENKTNTVNNTAPLFLNLGPKSDSDSDKKPIKDIVPLPIAMSSLKQENNSLNSRTNNNLNAVGENEKPLNQNKFSDEEPKVLRRDILAYMTAKRRR